MQDSTITIRTGSLFPWQFQLIAILIMIAGFTLIANRPLVGAVMVVAGGFVITASSGTQIDKNRKTYREYTSYYLIKRGKYKPYETAEKLFINSSTTSTKMHTAHTTQSSVFSNQEFDGYLKLSDGTKLYLLSKRNKEKLATELNRVANFLNIPVLDNTVRSDR